MNCWYLIFTSNIVYFNFHNVFCMVINYFKRLDKFIFTNKTVHKHEQAHTKTQSIVICIIWHPSPHFNEIRGGWAPPPLFTSTNAKVLEIIYVWKSSKKFSSKIIIMYKGTTDKFHSRLTSISEIQVVK